MRPHRFPSMSLRDPGYGAVAPFAPDPADPTMWGWWDADFHMNSLLAPTIWGDHSNRTANKTVNSGLNLGPQTGGYGFCGITTPGDYENIFPNSEAVNGWSYSNATPISASRLQFNATNGTGYRNLYFEEYKPSTQYKFSIDAKYVSGNANLQIYGGATTQNITVTGAWANYEVTFTTPASGAVAVGIRDTNGAGFGQVDLRYAHVRQTSLTQTYVQTSILPIPQGINGHYASCVGRLGNNGNVNWQHTLIGVLGVTNPCTLYQTLYMTPYNNTGRFFSIYGGTVYNLFYSMETSGTRTRVYTNLGVGRSIQNTLDLVSRQWAVMCVVVDGANSLLRVDQGANSVTVTGTLSNLDASGGFRTIGNDGFDGLYAPHRLTDFIGFLVAHDAPTRELYMTYLKQKVGI